MNTLLALVVLEHEFHTRVASWVEGLGASPVPVRAACWITELGFVRVLRRAQPYGLSITQARELLLQVKNSDGVRRIFIPDDRDISHLPRWFRTPKETTDGHLAELPRANEAVLATLDRQNPGAFVIPQNRHP